MTHFLSCIDENLLFSNLELQIISNLLISTVASTPAGTS
jgi:hypothetical protein